jgi:hypothetical protein
MIDWHLRGGCDGSLENKFCRDTLNILIWYGWAGRWNPERILSSSPGLPQRLPWVNRILNRHNPESGCDHILEHEETEDTEANNSVLCFLLSNPVPPPPAI